VVEQVAEARVGLFDRAEAGELAHRPQPAAVHRVVGTPREGIGAWVAELLTRVEVAEVVLGVKRLDRMTRDRREQRLALQLLLGYDAIAHVNLSYVDLR
jgi:hypothetical protein